MRLEDLDGKLSFATSSALSMFMASLNTDDLEVLRNYTVTDLMKAKNFRGRIMRELYPVLVEHGIELLDDREYKKILSYYKNRITQLENAIRAKQRKLDAITAIVQLPKGKTVKVTFEND